MPSGKGEGKESNADSGGLASGQCGELGGVQKGSKSRKDNLSETSTLGNYRRAVSRKRSSDCCALKCPNLSAFHRPM